MPYYIKKHTAAIKNCSVFFGIIKVAVTNVSSEATTGYLQTLSHDTDSITFCFYYPAPSHLIHWFIFCYAEPPFQVPYTRKQSVLHLALSHNKGNL